MSDENKPRLYAAELDELFSIDTAQRTRNAILAGESRSTYEMLLPVRSEIECYREALAYNDEYGTAAAHAQKAGLFLLMAILALQAPAPSCG